MAFVGQDGKAVVEVRDVIMTGPRRSSKADGAPISPRCARRRRRPAGRVDRCSRDPMRLGGACRRPLRHMAVFGPSPLVLLGSRRRPETAGRPAMSWARHRQAGRAGRGTGDWTAIPTARTDSPTSWQRSGRGRGRDGRPRPGRRKVRRMSGRLGASTTGRRARLVHDGALHRAHRPRAVPPVPAAVGEALEAGARPGELDKGEQPPRYQGQVWGGRSGTSSVAAREGLERSCGAVGVGVAAPPGDAPQSLRTSTCGASPGRIPLEPGQPQR